MHDSTGQAVKPQAHTRGRLDAGVRTLCVKRPSHGSVRAQWATYSHRRSTPAYRRTDLNKTGLSYLIGRTPPSSSSQC